MELDVNENKIDELELILQVLEGTSNLDFEYVKNSKGDPEYTVSGRFPIFAEKH